MNGVVPNRYFIRRVVGSCDWGFVHAGVLQAWGVDGDGRMYLLAEHYHTRRAIDWWTARVLEMDDAYEVDAWYCDPAEPAYIQQFREAGVNAVPATNDIAPGINAVQARLAPENDGRPRLFVYENALLLRDEALVEAKQPWSTAQEVPEYVWAKNTGGQTLKDKPADAHNHGLDALRYAVASEDLSASARPLDDATLGYFDDLPGGFG